MEKYVFFKTANYTGFVDKDSFLSYCFENELTPLVYSIVECTQDAIEELFTIMEDDEFMFWEIIDEEIENNFLTFYSN